MSAQAVIAANRFGLGARPGEIAAIGGDAHGLLNLQRRNAGFAQDFLVAVDAQAATVHR